MIRQGAPLKKYLCEVTFQILHFELLTMLNMEIDLVLDLDLDLGLDLELDNYAYIVCIDIYYYQ